MQYYWFPDNATLRAILLSCFLDFFIDRLCLSSAQSQQEIPALEYKPTATIAESKPETILQAALDELESSAGEEQNTVAQTPRTAHSSFWGATKQQSEDLKQKAAKPESESEIFQEAFDELESLSTSNPIKK